MDFHQSLEVKAQDVTMEGFGRTVRCIYLEGIRFRSSAGCRPGPRDN
jgi:hypothetical protein